MIAGLHNKVTNQLRSPPVLLDSRFWQITKSWNWRLTRCKRLTRVETHLLYFLSFSSLSFSSYWVNTPKTYGISTLYLGFVSSLPLTNWRETRFFFFFSFHQMVRLFYIRNVQRITTCGYHVVIRGDPWRQVEFSLKFYPLLNIIEFLLSCQVEKKEASVRSLPQSVVHFGASTVGFIKKKKSLILSWKKHIFWTQTFGPEFYGLSQTGQES